MRHVHYKYDELHINHRPNLIMKIPFNTILEQLGFNEKSKATFNREIIWGKGSKDNPQNINRLAIDKVRFTRVLM